MSLHVSADIHTFFLASRYLGLGMDLHRDAKIPSFLVRVVGGRRGIRVRFLRYLVCSLRGELPRHPRTNYWSELCRRSRASTFLKRRQSFPRM